MSLGQGTIANNTTFLSPFDYVALPPYAPDELPVFDAFAGQIFPPPQLSDAFTLLVVPWSLPALPPAIGFLPKVKSNTAAVASSGYTPSSP